VPQQVNSRSCVFTPLLAACPSVFSARTVMLALASLSVVAPGKKKVFCDYERKL
jgi:hypothetical protein